MRFVMLMMIALVVGCLDEIPEDATPPVARVVTAWDPLLCSDERQRVVVELEDDDGFALSSSAACRVGSLTLDVRKWGFYAGRVYAWMLGEPIRSVMPVRIAIDAPIIRWWVATPR